MSKEEQQQRQGGKEEPSTLTAAAVPTTTTSKKKPRRSPSAAAAAREPSPPPQYVGDSSSEEDDDASKKKASVVSLGNVVPFERRSTKQQHRRDANDDADVGATAVSANGAADAPPAGTTPHLGVEDSHVQALAQGKAGPCAMEGGIDDEDDEADAFDDRSGGGGAAAAVNATANANANASSARATTASAAPQGWVASGGTTGNFAPCPLGRVTLLFDLNGVLLVNPRDPATGRRVPRLRPGVENLARLCGKFRLGVYSSATLQTVRRATSAVVFGMMASGSSNGDDNNNNHQQQQQQQVFELMLCRQHCRPAPKVRRENCFAKPLSPTTENSSRPIHLLDPPNFWKKHPHTTGAPGPGRERVGHGQAPGGALPRRRVARRARRQRRAQGRRRRGRKHGGRADLGRARFRSREERRRRGERERA